MVSALLVAGLAIAGAWALLSMPDDPGGPHAQPHAISEAADPSAAAGGGEAALVEPTRSVAPRTFADAVGIEAQARTLARPFDTPSLESAAMPVFEPPSVIARRLQELAAESERTASLEIGPNLDTRALGLTPDRPMVAIVIDDLGPSRALSRNAIELDPPVTLAFLAYANDLGTMVEDAARRGHEVFLHLGMEPIGSANPGPMAISVGMDEAEIRRRTEWALARVPAPAGVNNHMGSRVTADEASLTPVMEVIRERGLIFLDSRTSPASIAETVARAAGIPTASRDIFLDNEPTYDAVMRQLAQTVAIARRTGTAIAIGHPAPATIAALRGWIPKLGDAGVSLVAASEIIRVRTCRRAPLAERAGCGDLEVGAIR